MRTNNALLQALSLLSLTVTAACVETAPPDTDIDDEICQDCGPIGEAAPADDLAADGSADVSDSAAVAPEPKVVCDSACQALEKLPYGGKFLGVSVYNTSLANTRVESQAALRFRAEHTGKIVSFRTWLKTNEGTLYDHDDYEHDDPDCGVPNSVAAEKCGYSRKYGGSAVFELRADDGSSSHLPSSTVLVKTKAIVDERTVQSSDPDHKFVKVKFESPISVTAGKLYHLVHRQTKSDRGAFSINGGFQHAFDPDLASGPFYGNDLATLRYSNGAWSARKGYTPFFEMHYDDDGNGTVDAVKGQAFATGTFSLGSAEARVDGSKRARLKIVVPSRGSAGGSWKADTLWVLVAKLGSQTDKPLTVELKNSAGKVLGGTKKIAASSITRSTTGFRSSNGTPFTVKWNKVKLDVPQTLTAGGTYYVELSAPSGAGYTVGVTQDMSVSWPFEESKSLGNKDGEKLVAQVSTNGGSSWGYANAGYGAKRSVVMPAMVQMVP